MGTEKCVFAISPSNSIPCPACHTRYPIESLIRDFGMARQLRNNQDLARFVIQGEANGRQLGTGSYGSVEEVSLFIAELPVS